MSDTSPFEHPKRIGPYHILQVLGEGGMGVVYDAQQKKPVARRVALKMIKVGMDSREVMRRFQSEQQALAVMDHPGIAKVFGGGLTEEGRPYFAMELVKGIPITEYCDSHRLTTRERVALMIETCAAVQHAHQKGVIHRDLKPSNILVGIQDGRPVPKIIDFGIAKAIGGAGSGESIALTRLGQMVGTPQYMSPEQAEMSGLDVDTRADIYSLGTVLYELVAGALPLSLDEPAAAATPFVMRHHDAPRPSLRYSSLGDSRQSVARFRRTDPSSLRRELRGDLDWIVMKAIDADRTRRYDTANALAMELERYLAHEPIRARPPSPAYQVGKFVRRNRGAVSSAAVALLSIIGFAASTALQARQIGLERDRTAREAVTAQRISDFLVGLFTVSDPSEARGSSVTAREILDRGVVSIRTELTEEPEIRGRLMLALGRVYTGLGLYDDAEELLMESMEARTTALGPADSTLAFSLQSLAWLYHRERRLDEALPLARETVRIHAAVYGEVHFRYARVLQVLGMIQRDLGNFNEGRTALTRALEIRRDILDPAHADIGWSLYHLGWLAVQEGEYQEADGHYKEAVAILETALGSDNPQLGFLYNDVAVLQEMVGDYEAARDMHEKVLTLREATLGPDHPDVAQSLSNLSVVLRSLGDQGGALERLLRALSIREQTLGPSNPLVASTLNNIGLQLQEMSRYREARDRYHEALEIYEEVLGPSDLRLVSILNNLGYLYRYVGDAETALPFLERSLRIGEDAYGQSHPHLVSTLTNLGLLKRDIRRYHEALPYLERAYEIQVETLGENFVEIEFFWVVIGEILISAGDYEEGATLQARAIERLEAAEGIASGRLVESYWNLALARLRMGQTAAADSLFRHALEIARGAEAIERLPRPYAYWETRTNALLGRRNEAIVWLNRLLREGYEDPWLLRDPALDLIREHPEYIAAAAKVRETISLAR